MNLLYILSFPAWFIVFITAIARINDMKKSEWSKRANFRRIGLLGILAVSIAMLVQPFTLAYGVVNKASYISFIMGYSMAAVWMTTPHMPPWALWILGEHRLEKSENFGHFLAKELKALKDGWAPTNEERRQNLEDRRKQQSEVNNDRRKN